MYKYKVTHIYPGSSGRKINPPVTLHPRLDIREGTVGRADDAVQTRYQIIDIPGNMRARLMMPGTVTDPSVQSQMDQRFIQCRLFRPDFKDRIEETKKAYGAIQVAGGKLIEDLVPEDSTAFASDATNYPYNEGYFAVRDGSLLPLPPRSYTPAGKHYFFSMDEHGSISFPLVDLDDPAAVKAAGSGFTVPKIIHDGTDIGITDIVPGCGRLLIGEFRGHIGQIFREDEYSEKSSKKRAVIHEALVQCLRESVKYKSFIDALLNGMPHSFSGMPEDTVTLPVSRYAHTYWVKALKHGEQRLLSVKTYPLTENKKVPGFTFRESPSMLRSVAGSYGYEITDAFIGTNGQDVRVLVPQDGKMAPLTRFLDGTSIGDYFNRPLANFLIFSWT